MLTFFHLVLLKKLCSASLKAHWKSGRKNCARKRRFNSYRKKMQLNWTNKFTKYIRNIRWNFIRIHRKTQKKRHLKDSLTRYERSQAVALNAIVRLLADIAILLADIAILLAVLLIISMSFKHRHVCQIRCFLNPWNKAKGKQKNLIPTFVGLQ